MLLEFGRIIILLTSTLSCFPRPSFLRLERTSYVRSASASTHTRSASASTLTHYFLPPTSCTSLRSFVLVRFESTWIRLGHPRSWNVDEL
ncbi:hypothetical protein C8R46DRAFT_1069717, partial [Mycena filopes]